MSPQLACVRLCHIYYFLICIQFIIWSWIGHNVIDSKRTYETTQDWTVCQGRKNKWQQLNEWKASSNFIDNRPVCWFNNSPTFMWYFRLWLFRSTMLPKINDTNLEMCHLAITWSVQCITHTKIANDSISNFDFFFLNEILNITIYRWIDKDFARKKIDNVNLDMRQ